MIFFYSALMETEEQQSKFQYIYERYYGLMYHIAFSITQNSHHAEDAVHETCLALIDKIDILRVDSEKEFIAYLRTVTRNRSIDYLRRWCHGQDEISDILTDSGEISSNMEEVVLSGINLEQAVRQMRSMPEKYRNPLIMKIKGYSITEIANTLDLTEGTVKTRIFRAREMLKKIFDA